MQSVLNEMLSSPKAKMTGLLMCMRKAEGKCGKETAMISTLNQGMEESKNILLDRFGKEMCRV